MVVSKPEIATPTAVEHHHIFSLNRSTVRKLMGEKYFEQSSAWVFNFPVVSHLRVKLRRQAKSKFLPLVALHKPYADIDVLILVIDVFILVIVLSEPVGILNKNLYLEDRFLRFQAIFCICIFKSSLELLGLAPLFVEIVEGVEYLDFLVTLTFSGYSLTFRNTLAIYIRSVNSHFRR